MKDRNNFLPKDALRFLEWDSNHFDFSVGQILFQDLDHSALHQTLSLAKQKDLQLVYWATQPEWQVSSSLLRDFSGMLVDQKATFSVDLDADFLPQSPTLPSLYVAEYPYAPATERLLALGIAAGHYSRFNVDPHISKEKFEELYRIWMNRSALRELADVVLVVSNDKASRDIMGLVTVSGAATTGSIGLIAVLDSARGKGVGSILMRAAHQWMIARNVRKVDVVTQLINKAACKLYERSGYHLSAVQHYYHFWVNL